MNEENVTFNELQPGTALYDGKYIIERVLGAGGFGITYYARHAKLNKYFAIKEFFINGYCVRNVQHFTILLQGIQDDVYDKYRHKFVEEAQTLAKLDHPGIVKVVDVFDENGTSYIVMPFLSGENLQEVVEKNGKLPYELAVNFMAQVCEALDYCHKRSILHRDVKPANIMITPENRTVLIDFGSAREFVHDKTQSHTAMLTQGYAPPEQYSSVSRKGAYSDIYSIGATFYFTVTGVKPTDAAARLLENLVEPKTINSKLSDTANRTILKAMEIKPENRYQNVDGLMYELTKRKDWRNPVVEKGKKSKGLSIFLIICLLALCGGGVVWYLENQKKAEISARFQENLLQERAEIEARLQEEARQQEETRQHEEEQRRLLSATLNGRVINLRVRLLDENSTYLQPTEGDLDGSVWYMIIDGQAERVSRAPATPPERAFIYSGQMRNGLPHGEGEAKYDDDTTYEGSFQRGLRHGRGIRTFPNGTTYEGEHLEGKAHGRGRQTNTDGSFYDGNWANDLEHGFGRLVDADGNERAGNFENGRMAE